MRSTLAIVLVAAAVLLLAACGDDDEAPSGSPTGTVSGTPTASAVVTGTATPTSTAGETYTNERFGYSVTLPTGWRVAGGFMEAYAGTGAHPHAIGYSADTGVFTDMSGDDEWAFVRRVTSETPVGLTGIEVWLDFFLQRTVEVYPTRASRDQIIKSASEGNVWYLVTNVRDTPLTSGQVGTRFDLDIASDYGRFVYDTVFVPPLENCARCRGFIIQTVAAGVPSTGPLATGEVPPAAYPRTEFEAIVTNFSAEMLESVPPIAYTDELGFSFSYPGDLTLNDLTGPTPGAGKERVLEFRSPDNRARGFIVSWDEETPPSLEEWGIVKAACVPDSMTPTTLGGEPGFSCERAVLGPTEPAVLAEHDGRIFLITSAQDLREFEFADIIASFEY